MLSSSSLAIPIGRLNCADAPVPSLHPATPVPQSVDTTCPLFTTRRLWFPLSDTTRLPSDMRTTADGFLKHAVNRNPSVKSWFSNFGQPAIVETRHNFLPTTRTQLFPLSTQTMLSFASMVMPRTRRNFASSSGPSLYPRPSPPVISFMPDVKSTVYFLILPSRFAKKMSFSGVITMLDT